MLSENLKQIRKEKGYTKVELGKKAKIHSNTIKNIENGKGTTYAILEKLATALEVTIGDLTK